MSESEKTKPGSEESTRAKVGGGGGGRRQTLHSFFTGGNLSFRFSMLKIKIKKENSQNRVSLRARNMNESNLPDFFFDEVFSKSVLRIFLELE